MLLCILISCSFAFGQATTSLRGVVKDPSGALVPGATITITDATVDKTLTAVTNAAGTYQFPQIPPAKYVIKVAAKGFGTQSKSAELLVNQPATVDFKLTMQNDTVTVDVSASTQSLNTTDASMGNAVSNDMIQALPMEGRDPVSLLALQPGVLFLGEGGGNSTTNNPNNASSTDSRQGSVSGSRSDQGNITLDGLDDNDQVNGFAFTGVLRSTLDSTEEFRVTTSNGTADSGRSSGAQVSLITKKGTNRFHGAAYEYYRPTNTVSNNFFLKKSQLSSGKPNIPAKYVKNVFGASLGGPVFKDKLFFFGNYEGLRQAIDDVASATVPTASFLAGTIQYVDPSGNNQTLSSKQLATLDAPCATNKFQGASVCPWGPGANPNVLSYFAKVPPATGGDSGDGLNSGSLSFPVKIPTTQNTSIAKLDYNLTPKQQIFVRGNYQKDTYAGDANLPGQSPAYLKEYNTKGLAFGHTWAVTNNIVNDLRYGYVRQSYGQSGLGVGDYVAFRFLTQPSAQTRATISAIPVHNIVDTLTVVKGNHTITAGGNWRLVQNISSTTANSFSGASTNPYWLGGNPPDPSTLGSNVPKVAGSFSNSYAIAYANLVGTVPSVSDVFNYKITSATAATLLKDGTAIDRHFQANEFEYFIQDSWHVRPNLTITAGLRHTILQTPYETNKQQITPTINTHNWFLERGYQAAKGLVDEANLQFSPSGKANGKPGYWPKKKFDFAPRLAVVYSPNSKTSIRAGAGIYFDHYGEAITSSLSSEASFGLSTTYTNPAGVQGFETAPRFTGPNNIPAIPLPTAPQSAKFPFTPPALFGINFGVDNRLKTPYSEAFNLSVQRELPGGWVLEQAYVGRIGRHLLQQLDIAEPVNFNDPKGSSDYFTAAKKLSALVDSNNGNNCVSVPTIPYFEDVFSYMKGFNPAVESDGVTPNPCPTPNATATQAIYTYEWAPYRYGLGETTSLADLDFFCYNGQFNVNYNCPAKSRFWQQQFSSLYAWSTIGNSSYNALQATLRHPTTHGVTVDVSYTFSKSIDMNSGTERGNEFSNDNNGGSAIQNSWNPKLNKAVSDFDTRHLVNGDVVYVLPVGRGKRFLGSTNLLVDSILGGWTYGGIARWTSGLPFSLNAPGWATNWQLQGYAVNTGPVKIRKHYDYAHQAEQVFDDRDKINNNVATANGPVRLPYPGEAGQRNAYRGDGFFDIDSTLSKVWKIGDFGNLKFDGEVYNLTNTNRFDTASIATGLTGGTLGAYGSTLPSQSNFRRMQFGLRFDF